MKCACDWRAASDAEFRLASNFLNGTDVASYGGICTNLCVK